MRAWFVVAIAATLSAGGCGDAGGGASAGGSAGESECVDEWCKGDPVGTWNIVADEPCAYEPVEAGSCPGLQCTLKSTAASGTLVLPSGGQGAAANYTATGVFDCDVPTSCLGAGDCAGLADTCTATDAGCRCELTFTDTVMLEGTWSINQDLGGLLQIEDTATKSQWATGNFCVGDGALVFGALAQQILPELGLVSASVRVRAEPG